MITYHNGDILESGADVICHQVNCMGVMGAGLAKQVAKRWSAVYLRFQEVCMSNNPQVLLGRCQLDRVVCNDKYVQIVSMFAQNDYGRDKCYTNYEAVRSCMEYVKQQYVGKVIAIPYKIGCGLGGGDWNIVHQIIKDVFADYDGDVQIWKL